MIWRWILFQKDWQEYIHCASFLAAVVNGSYCLMNTGFKATKWHYWEVLSPSSGSDSPASQSLDMPPHSVMIAYCSSYFDSVTWPTAAVFYICHRNQLPWFSNVIFFLNSESSRRHCGVDFNRMPTWEIIIHIQNFKTLNNFSIIKDHHSTVIVPHHMLISLL